MSREDNPVYRFMDTDHPIIIEIPQAFLFKTEFGMNLLKMFEGDNINTISVTLALDDEKIIEIWWWFISKKLGDSNDVRERAIDNLTRKSLSEFKECLWAAIVNFSDPAIKQALLDLKRRLPELLRKQVNQSLDELDREVSQQSETS